MRPLLEYVEARDELAPDIHGRGGRRTDRPFACNELRDGGRVERRVPFELERAVEHAHSALQRLQHRRRREASLYRLEEGRRNFDTPGKDVHPYGAGITEQCARDPVLDERRDVERVEQGKECLALGLLVDAPPHDRVLIL